MRALVDLNVVLDVLLDRAPHADAAAALWAAVERRELEGALAAHAVTTLHCLSVRARGRVFGERCVRDVLSVFGVAPVTADVCQQALTLGGADFEDAVSSAAAVAAGCDVIIARDATGFRGAPLRVLEPATALAVLRATRMGKDVSGP